MVNKKLLRLKCSECRRLLNASCFTHPATVLQGVDKLVCITCRKHCVHCDQFLPLSVFSDAESGLCDHCLAKKHASSSNVYFRFPTLRYRQSPFPIEKYRQSIEREGQSSSDDEK